MRPTTPFSNYRTRRCAAPLSASVPRARAICWIRWNWPSRSATAASEDELLAALAAAKTNVPPFERKRPARKPLPEHLPRHCCPPDFFIYCDSYQMTSHDRLLSHLAHQQTAVPNVRSGEGPMIAWRQPPLTQVKAAMAQICASRIRNQPRGSPMSADQSRSPRCRVVSPFLHRMSETPNAERLDPSQARSISRISSRVSRAAARSRLIEIFRRQCASTRSAAGQRRNPESCDGSITGHASVCQQAIVASALSARLQRGQRSPSIDRSISELLQWQEAAFEPCRQDAGPNLF